MAFTRKFLSAMGIEADKVDEIINAHIEVVDGLKEERDNFKKNADKAYPHIYNRFVKEFDAKPEDFNRVQTIRNSQYPILLSAGSMEKCEELFEQMTANNPQPTHTVILPGCNHGNGMYKQTEMYQNAIREFAEQYM